MSARRSFSEILADPRQGRWAVIAVLTLLSWLGLILRLGLDFDGVLDTDVLNFGLAGYRFDVLDHQPHPPGYPGYVVMLKMVHVLAPWLDPIALAKWTTRLCGLGITFAAYWAAAEVLGGGPKARGRALACAAVSVLHPVLWFYGGDGQSHGAEALLTLVLFAAVVRAKRSPSRLKLLLVVFAFALAGSVRPTIPLLSSPLLVWLFWRRPIADWLLAGVVGVASVAAWYVPTVMLSGGLDLYRRASRALITDMFVASYSMFGERANLRGVSANLAQVGWATLFSIIPLLAIGRTAWSHRWVRAIAAVCVVNIVFYTVMFTAEIGYLIQIAALSVLALATVGSATRLDWIRIGALFVLCPLVVFAGPPSVRVPYSFDANTPTYARVVNAASEQRYYREVMCGVSEGEDTILLTDNYSTTNSRWLAIVCPNVTVALFLHDFPLNPEMDNWLIFYSDRMDAVPPDVPLEPGEPSLYTLPPATRIVVAIDSTKELRQAMTVTASCPPHLYVPYGDDLSMSAWPTSCFDKLRFGAHTITVQSSGAPHFGADFE